jgi:hypothetical protein
MPGIHSPFLILIKLHCSFHKDSLKQPRCHLWLGCLSSAALIPSIFFCTWLKCVYAIKSLDWGRAACLLLPQGKQYPEGQPIMDEIFQSRCDGAHRFNQLRSRRNSRWILLFHLSLEWVYTGSSFSPWHSSSTPMMNTDFIFLGQDWWNQYLTWQVSLLIPSHSDSSTNFKHFALHLRITCVSCRCKCQ